MRLHPAAPGGYHPVKVMNGTRIDLMLPMPTERIISHPHVTGNLGRVAMQRGPIIFCIEQADHDADVWDIALPDDSELTASYRPELLGGVMVITADAAALSRPPDVLYRRYEPDEEIEVSPVTMTAVPYYAWANREAGPMQTWIPTLPPMEYY